MPAQLFVVLLLLLAGCAAPAPRVERWKEPAFTGKLSRALVLAVAGENSSRLGPNYLQGLGADLAGGLGRQRVPTDLLHLPQHTADRDPQLAAAARRFQPAQLLELTVPKVNVYNGAIVSWQLHADLIDLATGRTVWRADVHVEFIPATVTVADEIIRQLQSDFLL